jgi:PLP dependent protein
MYTTRIQASLKEVTERIAAAERARGPGSTVKIVAVSKRHPASAIRAAYEAGVRDFGENYAQEFCAKAEELRDLTDIRWHFIGHLQSNKVRRVLMHASYIHSVDSEKLLREIGKHQADRLPRLFIEVNAGGEAQKSGVDVASASALIGQAKELLPLQVCGLMTMPPLDGSRASEAFAATAELAKKHGLQDLSMGTTGDLELAIAAGATWVRIGTALFGERPSR